MRQAVRVGRQILLLRIGSQGDVSRAGIGTRDVLSDVSLEGSVIIRAGGVDTPARRVAKMYTDALDKGGWKVTKRDIGTAYNYELDSGSDKISLEVYDWQKTGVIIRKR